jgi:hypothetical protein
MAFLKFGGALTAAAALRFRRLALRNFEAIRIIKPVIAEFSTSAVPHISGDELSDYHH